jgi:anti-repressor protein
MLDQDDLGTHIVRGDDGHERPAQIVTEAGLYDLILRSRRPDARDFRRWVIREVLPTIRRTGVYAIPQTRVELTRLEILELALDSERCAVAAEAAVHELEPSAQAWDVLASTDGDYAVREVAHILNRDPGIDTGQQRLFRILRDFGVIDRINRPYASHAAHVRLRPTYYLHPETGEEIAAQPQVRITVAGLRYLHSKFGGCEQLNLKDGRAADTPTTGSNAR